MKPLGTQDLFSFCSSSLEGVALVLRPLFFIFKIYFLLFWLRWVFVALHGLSLVLASMGYTLAVEHGLVSAMASLAENGP